MKDDKYTHMDMATAFGFLANALGGGGDQGQSFPQSDAEDLSRGLRFIPGEVTMARRRGERVIFVQSCQNRCCWYWQFQDGSRTYYWERWAWEQMAQANGITLEEDEFGIKTGKAGGCPLCGNLHTSGGHVEKP